MTGLGVQYPRSRDSIPSRGKIFSSLLHSTRTDLEPKKTFSTDTAYSSCGGKVSTLSIHLQPVLRLRIRGGIPPMPIHLKSVSRDIFAVTFLSE